MMIMISHVKIEGKNQQNNNTIFSQLNWWSFDNFKETKFAAKKKKGWFWKMKIIFSLNQPILLRKKKKIISSLFDFRKMNYLMMWNVMKQFIHNLIKLWRKKKTNIYGLNTTHNSQIVFFFLGPVYTRI